MLLPCCTGFALELEVGCCTPPPELRSDAKPDPDPVLESPGAVGSVDVIIPALEFEFGSALAVTLATPPPLLRPEYKNPPMPVSVGAIVMVLVPTTRTELPAPVPTSVSVSVPKLTDMPLMVTAGPLGERVLPPTMRKGGEDMRSGRYSGGVVGEGETRVGKVMLCADGAPGSLTIRTRPTGGAKFEGALIGLMTERETTVSSDSVIAGEPGRSVIGGPVGGVKTRDEAEG